MSWYALGRTSRGGEDLDAHVERVRGVCAVGVCGCEGPCSHETENDRTCGPDGYCRVG